MRRLADAVSATRAHPAQRLLNDRRERRLPLPLAITRHSLARGHCASPDAVICCPRPVWPEPGEQADGSPGGSAWRSRRPNRWPPARQSRVLIDHCMQLTRQRSLNNSPTSPVSPIPADAHRDRGSKCFARRPAIACGLRWRPHRHAGDFPSRAGHRLRWPVRNAGARCRRRGAALQEQQQDLRRRDGVGSHARIAMHRLQPQHAGVEGACPLQVRNIHAGFQHALQRWGQGRRRLAHAASACRGSWPGSICTYSTGSPCASSTAAICRWRAR